MSSPAPKRRLDVRENDRRSAGPGKRAARPQRSAWQKFLPSPAMAGALALITAGVGSVAYSSQTDSPFPQNDYAAISATYADDTDSSVDVSRSADRRVSAEQAAAQVAQQQSQIREAVQARADDLALNRWVLPVTGYRITARFGQSSGLWSSGRHTGLDFAGPSGSTIVSVAAGTVKSSGYAGAYGNKTEIVLEDGTEIWYCHQSRVVVSPGDQVAAGDVIGYTGSTGNVTGPHLHLEVHPGGGGAVDPFAALQAHDVNP